LKAACIEAAEGECKVKDFEVGLFNGKYITEVPEGYFEHLRQLRGKKKAVVGMSEEPAGRAMLVANSGPMDVALRQQKGPDDDGARVNGMKGPEYREDIRCVVFDDAIELHLLIEIQPLQHWERASGLRQMILQWSD
jgi:amidophosphoribosyltransferase